MIITPILKDPKVHGGTLYTFPSASRDMNRAFTNSEYEFAFSNFACLNLPDFRYGKFEENDYKGIYLDNLYQYSIDTLDNLNSYLRWHLQSYVMNYEVAILNENYNNEKLRTPSERIFFNWLQKVGGIKFSGISETLNGYGSDITYDETLGGESFLETADKSKSYRIGNKLYIYKGGEWKIKVLLSDTVQYIGTIDMVNNVNIDYDSFNEIYLNIPSGVGKSETISFNNVYDDNYRKGRIISVEGENNANDYIIGRDPDELGMSNDDTLKAIYDIDHSYIIDNGYCINFNEEDYPYGSIEDMNLESDEDFEFNCVLIYYRIRKGNGEWVTNLYGVLFLEEITISDYDINSDDEDDIIGYIQRYPKFKKGNSWGLKLDLKIDAQPDSQLKLRDNEYVDPNEGGAGMQMFVEALMQLNDCSKLFYEVKKENTDIEERLYTLENIMSGVDSVYELRDIVGVLRTRVEMMQPSIDALSGRMDDMENRISKLESNVGHLIGLISSIK